MNYEIILPSNIYRAWDSFKEYTNVADMLSFKDFIMENYPECVSVAYTIPSPRLLDMTFTFESEAHYTWFLLQQ